MEKLPKRWLDGKAWNVMTSPETTRVTECAEQEKGKNRNRQIIDDVAGRIERC